jgi:DNA-binding NtrC family response regulator
MPIHEMAAANEFRQDLLYRINTVEVKIAPLRERPEDIPLLVEHFLHQYCIKYNKPVMKVQASTLKRLTGYRWPGNVRELQHAVERAVIMTDEKTLKPEDFLLAAAVTAQDGLMIDSYNLTEIEQGVIRKALQKHGGNVSQAAAELGLTRTSLYRRMQKYGL